MIEVVNLFMGGLWSESTGNHLLLNPHRSLAMRLVRVGIEKSNLRDHKV